MIKIHLEGQTYGRLFVMYDFEKEIGKSKKNMHICHCKCICGNEVDVFACHLRSGHTQSCGCYKNEQIRKTKNKKHELSHNHLYKKFYQRRRKTPSFSYGDISRVLRSPRRAEGGQYFC